MEWEIDKRVDTALCANGNKSNPDTTLAIERKKKKNLIR